MAWTRLADRIDDPGMPLVLAGPMLRKVTAQSETVWVALRKAATVTLEIRTSDILAATVLATVHPATEATTRVGPRLHLVAVTARMAMPLVPGRIYLGAALLERTSTGAISIT